MVPVPKIRILHVVLSLDFGGTEKIVVEVVNGLSPEEFESEIVCLDHGGGRVSSVKPDVPIHVIGRQPGLSPITLIRCFNIIKKINPHIVHFRNFAAYFWGGIPSIFQRNVKIVYSDHSDIVQESLNNDNKKIFVRKGLRPFTDSFLTNCFSFKEKLLEVLNLQSNDVTVIYNGIDTNMFFPLSLAERQRVRVAYDLEQEAFVVGVVANFRAKKNIALAIQAMSDLITYLPLSRLVLVGGGEQEEELRTLVRELHLEGNVRFCGVIRDINQIVNAFDVFVFPSIHGEGMPNAVLEAMAAGIPVVASNIPGNVELLEGGKRGVLFANNDRLALVQAIMKIAKDPAFSRLLSEKGCEFIKKRHSLTQMIREYEKFYRSVYQGTGP